MTYGSTPAARPTTKTFHRSRPRPHRTPQYPRPDTDDEIRTEEKGQAGEHTGQEEKVRTRLAERSSVSSSLGDVTPGLSPRSTRPRPSATAPFQANTVRPITVIDMRTPISPATVATLRPHGRARTNTPKMIPSSSSIPKMRSAARLTPEHLEPPGQSPKAPRAVEDPGSPGWAALRPAPAPGRRA